MLAQMMMAQPHSHQNLTKRSASDAADDTEIDKNWTQQPRAEAIKRLDNEQTPVKKEQKNQHISNIEEWNTPQYLQQIALQQGWTESPNTQGNVLSENKVLVDGIRRFCSRG